MVHRHSPEARDRRRLRAHQLGYVQPLSGLRAATATKPVRNTTIACHRAATDAKRQGPASIFASNGEFDDPVFRNDPWAWQPAERTQPMDMDQQPSVAQSQPHVEPRVASSPCAWIIAVPVYTDELTQAHVSQAVQGLLATLSQGLHPPGLAVFNSRADQEEPSVNANYDSGSSGTATPGLNLVDCAPADPVANPVDFESTRELETRALGSGMETKDHEWLNLSGFTPAESKGTMSTGCQTMSKRRRSVAIGIDPNTLDEIDLLPPLILDKYVYGERIALSGNIALSKSGESVPKGAVGRVLRATDSETLSIWFPDLAQLIDVRTRCVSRNADD